MESSSSSSTRQSISRKRPASSTPINDSINCCVDFSLECPICLDELSEPKLLICGHNICPVCSVKIVKKDALGRFSHECPTCKRTTTVKEGLETNYALKDTLEKAKRMKDFYESMETERVRVERAEKENSTAEDDSIECDECRTKCVVKDAFACTSPPCARKTPLYFVCNKAREKIEVWSVKRLCALCACRQHRDHSLEELCQMLGFNTSRARNQFCFVAKMNASLPLIAKSKAKPVNLFSLVTTHFEKCFKDSVEKLRSPKKPLLNCEFDTLLQQSIETWLGTKAFFENEAQLKALVEECQQKIFTSYKKSLANIKSYDADDVLDQVNKLLEAAEKPATTSSKNDK